MLVRMQQRRGTASEWAAANPILANGEIAIETDTQKYKIGNGTENYNLLPYNVNAEFIESNYVSTDALGVADGVATLDESGKIPIVQLGNLIDGAPEILDTLSEISDAIANDANFAVTVNDAINNKANIDSPAFTGDVDFSGTDSLIGISQVPDQTTELAGKYLQTDGAAASWVDVPLDDISNVNLEESTSLLDGDILSYNSTTNNWTNFPPSSLVGPAGPANNLTVGTVEQLDEDSEPSVTITGVSPDQTINFGIPAGPSNVLSVGTVTTGNAGSDADVTISGESPSQSISFTIPRGDQGIQGETGPALTIRGAYNTLNDLTSAVPSPGLGDAYLVAARIYVWNGQSWVDGGPIVSESTLINPLFFA